MTHHHGEKTSFDQALTRIFAGLEHIGAPAVAGALMKGSRKADTNLRDDREMPSRHPGDNSRTAPAADGTVLPQAKMPLNELVVTLRNGIAERRLQAEQQLLREAETIVLNIRIAHAIGTLR